MLLKAWTRVIYLSGLSREFPFHSRSYIYLVLLRLIITGRPYYRITTTIMASAQPLVFRWGIVSTGFIAASFVKVSRTCTLFECS